MSRPRCVSIILPYPGPSRLKSLWLPASHLKFLTLHPSHSHILLPMVIERSNGSVWKQASTYARLALPSRRDSPQSGEYHARAERHQMQICIYSWSDVFRALVLMNA